MIEKKLIKTYTDLFTSKEETHRGFLDYAVEKNYCADNYIEKAKSFLSIAKQTESVDELINNADLRPFLLMAAGLSSKSLKYLSGGDQVDAILQLKEKFLIPAGDRYVDEVFSLYLLNIGDSLGGIARNNKGLIAQQKFLNMLLSCMNNEGVDYEWLDKRNDEVWHDRTESIHKVEKYIKAITWTTSGVARTLAFNLTMPLVKRNTNLCLFNCSAAEFSQGLVYENPEYTILLGELKGGIDPAGADEHWKAANTALERIRTAYTIAGHDIKTSYIAAAIKGKMAEEIFDQVESGKLTRAINITNDKQLRGYCEWLLTL